MTDKSADRKWNSTYPAAHAADDDLNLVTAPPVVVKASQNFGNFKDADGNPAAPYLMVFKTKSDDWKGKI